MLLQGLNAKIGCSNKSKYVSNSMEKIPLNIVCTRLTKVCTSNSKRVTKHQTVNIKNQIFELKLQ